MRYFVMSLLIGAAANCIIAIAFTLRALRGDGISEQTWRLVLLYVVCATVLTLGLLVAAIGGLI